jgi:hypothetical protein
MTMLVGAAIGAVLTLATVRASRSDARRLAIESGALRRSIIELSLFGHTTNQREMTIWFVHPGPRDATAIFACPFAIHNSGDKSTGELLVTITAPKGMIASDDVLDFEVIPAVLTTDMRRSVATYENLCQSSYVIPSLGPGATALIEEAFWLEVNQGIPGAADVKLKDGVPLRVKYAVNMKYVMSVRVSSQEASPLIAKFGVNCILEDDSRKVPEGVTATDLQDVVKKFNAMPRRDRMSHRLVTAKGLCITFDVDGVIEGNGRKVMIMKRSGTIRIADVMSIIGPGEAAPRTP